MPSSSALADTRETHTLRIVLDTIIDCMNANIDSAVKAGYFEQSRVRIHQRSIGLGDITGTYIAIGFELSKGEEKKVNWCFEQHARNPYYTKTANSDSLIELIAEHVEPAYREGLAIVIEQLAITQLSERGLHPIATQIRNKLSFL